MPDLPLVPGRDLDPGGAVAASQQLRVVACSATAGLLTEGPLPARRTRGAALGRHPRPAPSTGAGPAPTARVGSVCKTVTLDRHVGAVAPATSGGYVLAAGTGFLHIDDLGVVRELAQPEAGRSDVRMNDGACDALGRFWAGTMAYDESPGAGALYRLELDGTCTTVLTGLTIANGIGWSPTAQPCTSPTAEPDRRLRLRRGQGGHQPAPHDRRHREPGMAPDGLTVDEEGGIWVVFWGGGAPRMEPTAPC